MRLSDIQMRFKDLILGKELPEDFPPLFAANDGSLDKRLDIYRNNVLGNTGRALADNFPLLEKLVGRDFLNAMVRAYILQNPPSEGCLTFYGSDFDQFIAGYEPAKQFAYLPDVARLEILGNRAYHAEDDEALSVQELAAIPADGLATARLHLRDSVQLLRSRWPLEAIKDFCQNGGEAPDLSSGGTLLLIHRSRLDVQITKLSESEFEFLSRVQDRMLGETVTEILTDYPDFDFPKTLQAYMTLEIFRKE